MHSIDVITGNQLNFCNKAYEMVFKPGACRPLPGFFLVLLLSANVSMCVCPPPRLLITSGMMWYDIDPIRLVE